MKSWEIEISMMIPFSSVLPFDDEEALGLKQKGHKGTSASSSPSPPTLGRLLVPSIEILIFFSLSLSLFPLPDS